METRGLKHFGISKHGVHVCEFGQDGDTTKLQYAASAAANIVKKEKIVIITDSIYFYQWKKFERCLEDLTDQVIVITDNVPKEWCSNPKISLVHNHGFVKNFIEEISRLKLTIDSKEKQFDFMLPCGAYIEGPAPRIKFLEMLEEHSLLKGSLYSRPALPKLSLREKWLEDTYKNTHNLKETRFDHKSNARFMSECYSKSCCAIVLENSMSPNKLSCAALSEKSIWPFLMKIPAISISNPHIVAQLKKWKFELVYPAPKDIKDNLQKIKTIKDNISKDKNQWMDSATHMVEKNYKIVNRLSQLIENDFKEQMRKLGHTEDLYHACGLNKFQ